MESFYNKHNKILDILIVVLILFLFFEIKSCRETEYQIQKNKSEELIKEYKKQKEKDKLLSSSLRDSILIFRKKAELREKENSNLREINTALKSDLATLKNKPFKKLPQDLNGLVEYFNKRYNTNFNKPVESLVGLNIETGREVSQELEVGDRNQEVVLKQKQILENDSIIIGNLEKDKKDLKNENNQITDLMSHKDTLLKLGEENINVLNKQLKSQKRKSSAEKWLLRVSIPIAAFLGYKIAK